MYDANRNEETKRTEQNLYKAAFSGLHASAKLKREVFYMKNSGTKQIRVGRMAFICMLLAALLCMMSAISYAATDGETANPVTAVKIYIDGQDVSGQLQKQEDGSYISIKYGSEEEGDRAEVEIAAGAEEALGEDAEGVLELNICSENEAEDE